MSYSLPYSPCKAASKASMDCLDKNDYDRDKCLEYFQAYRDCKKAWVRHLRLHAPLTTVSHTLMFLMLLTQPTPSIRWSRGKPTDEQVGLELFELLCHGLHNVRYFGIRVA